MPTRLLFFNFDIFGQAPTHFGFMPGVYVRWPETYVF